MLQRRQRTFGLLPGLVARIATLLVASCLALTLPAAEPKPRIVVLTDISPPNIEPDDMESMIRLLVHADLFEIEGLVATTGWSNGGGQERPDLLHDLIRAYEQDLPNLRKRSNQTNHLTDESRQEIGYWPSPDYLRSRTLLGSRTRGLKFLGKDNDSPGSELILRLADERDERPLWVLGWGGGNTLAQSIWRAQHDRTSPQLQAFLGKLRFYAITDQDRGYEAGTPFDISAHQWMRREFSRDLMFLWDECAWTYQNDTGKRNWDQYATHVQGRGHLGRMYPKYRYGVEGDTPSFLHVFPNGLNDPDQPDQVGWGGSFVRATGPDKTTEAFTNHRDIPTHAVSRRHLVHFYPATFNSFVARMDWAQSGTGNRDPIVTINADSGTRPLRLTPAAGSTLTLDASASRDPDGHGLRFSWWAQSEAGTYPGPIRIDATNSARASLVVPPDAAGRTLHVVCEVTDDGTPPLTRYRRLIIEPTSASAAIRPRVVVLTDFPPLDVIPVGAGQGPADKRSDPDDIQSMVRFLLYSNELDVEGIVASAATLANVARKQHVLDILGLYDQVDENLRTHDPRYPTADHLRQRVWQGRDNTWGKPSSQIIGEGRDTEASEAIVRLVDGPDPRPIWFCVWGGPADLAQALWKVRATRNQPELERFLGKLRLYLIIRQDGSAQWLLDEFPGLFIIVSDRNYLGMFWNSHGADPTLSNLDWINAHIRTGHGPLGAAYPTSGANPNTPGVIEGDSPSFLHLVSAVRGLNDPDHPDQPGWGGQFIRPSPSRNHWFDDPAGGRTIWRWRREVQEDFARRADWMLRRER